MVRSPWKVPFVEHRRCKAEIANLSGAKDRERSYDRSLLPIIGRRGFAKRGSLPVDSSRGRYCVKGWSSTSGMHT